MPAYNCTTINIHDIPDFTKIPQGLPWVFDSTSLAFHLGIRNRTLRHAVARREHMYKVHYIPKKSGGQRTIHSPDRVLKFIQRKILRLILTPLPMPEHIGAFVTERSTRFSAEQHAGKPLLIVMDLQNFFPSTRRSWVRETIQHALGYPYEVASVLSDIMTVPMDLNVGRRYVVPQGAPTSGAICNLVAHYRLDKLLLKVCEEWGMAYTRYADDLAFSSIQKLSYTDTNKFMKEVIDTIRTSGYALNRKKVRVARAGKQQRLLGMTINQKPNVMRLQYRRMRARIHNCKHKGFDKVAEEMNVESGALLVSQIEGHISHYHMINPHKAARLKLQLNEAKDIHWHTDG